MEQITSLYDVAKKIANFTGDSIYVRFDPEVLDFTDSNFPKIVIQDQKNSSLSIELNDELLPFLLTSLKLSVFHEKNKIIAWNWKNFISYVLFKTKKNYVVGGKIIDLKIIESLCGRRLKTPQNYNEAFNRLKDLLQKNLWKEVENVYKNVQLPLITTVIPHLENIGILSKNSNKKLHAYYEIDGQENGRLKCVKEYKNGFVPHTMDLDFRKSILPRSENEFFLVFDYRGCEVYVLAHLAKDDELLELCKNPDIYVALFEKMFQKKIENKNDRDFAKKIFLPVIYGQSAFALSQQHGLSIDEAEMIVQRIYDTFPKSLTYIQSFQKFLTQHGYVVDAFNRRRINFATGKEYTVRNFAIQSPSALICLEKLVHLYFALKEKTDILYTVHDGYVVYVTKENMKMIKNLSLEILTSESNLCPGLRLRATCRAGRNLGELKSLVS